jgi:starch synthase (maltosyl-transferring)
MADMVASAPGRVAGLDGAHAVPPRIVHAMAGGDAVFARAAALGFSHVLMAPPWAAGARGNAYLTADFNRLRADAGAASLEALVAGAAREGLGLLLDVSLDRIAAEASLAHASGSPFEAPSHDMLVDPRRSEGADVGHARLAGPGDALVLANWWAAMLRDWRAAGVAGFRLLGLDAVGGASLRAFVGALRAALPGTALLAWTPGLDRAAAASLEGAGLDGVFSSLPWWDWQAGWLWEELAALSRIAPVLGVDGFPPDARHAGRPGDARSTALAAVLGQGWLHVAPGQDDAAVQSLNTALANAPVFAARALPGLPLGEAGTTLAVLRTDAPDCRSANRAGLMVVNGDAVRHATVHASSLLTATSGRFDAFSDVSEGDPGSRLLPGDRLDLAPGAFRIFSARALTGGAAATRADPDAGRRAADAPRLAIENPTPSVDGGAFPVKAVAGESLSVEADIVFDGHDKITAALRWHGPDGAWQEAPMRPLGNDRWTAALPLGVLGRHAYVVTAWRDRFETFRDELAKKSAAGVRIELELLEGAALVEAAAARSTGRLATALRDLLGVLTGAEAAGKLAAFLSPETARLMAEADDRPFLARTAPIPVDAERIGAGFASWYEIFPRSMSDDTSRHGTFADVERHLPRIAGMGFDVLYFPPISPIGRTNRKGRNNTLTPAPDDPGSPYAVGSADGGHDALHPELGTLADFQALRRAAAAHGLELAIDFAIQCSPDHPWLKQHPGWFDWRPDGTIRYAENPPKKYEDIVNVDFYARDAVPDLWVALCDVVLFWAEQGVRLFRVDNPHTKPLPFWEWMIGTVRAQYPDAVFLAEAFTRPKVMYRLAKVGFSQSYTYFTWRNAKRELEAYLTELDTEPPRDFFRPHFFVNTPDINPPFLQSSGRPGFLIRAALAATLSGLWGVYCGFELCEASAVPGKEEYLDSEKYQLRAWDWDRAGNIVPEITALNRLRRQNPALQTHRGVTFLAAYNDAVLYYEKATSDRSNVVLVAVSLDPHQAQEADFEVPLWRCKLPDDASLPMQDLLGGDGFVWHGKMQRLRLTPEHPYAIWRIRTA